MVGIRQVLRGVQATPDARIREAEDFALAVRPHLAAMTRLAARLGPSGQQEDVVQEALARAWRHRSQYDPGRGPVSPWLSAIVANEARRAGSRVRVPIRLAPIMLPQRSDERLDLEAGMTRLSVRQRQAIDCFYFVGLPVVETAAVMGCSEGTAKSTLADARGRLRQLLEEQ